MQKALFTVFLLFLLFPLRGQDRATIGGYVRDGETGEALVGANVVVLQTGKGTVSNEYGYYALSLPRASYRIRVSYLGYRDLEIELDLSQVKEKVQDFDLEPSAQQLEEVRISARARNTNVSSLETGVQSISIQKIRRIPALMGEIDVIKAIQLLPGVSFTSEGSSGFTVRGGGRDQNLVLLDEATVYNPSHLLGFFSVFNNDAIKDVKLYKGDIPARSGGRLASLLDVRMKEGNSKQFHGRGGIGTISSRLTLEGPIVKDKLSFLIAGRRTYADLFLLFSRDENISGTRLFFSDVNGKLNWRINDNNNIYLSTYYGKDTYGNKDFGGLNFGNRTGTLRWNHLYSKKLFSNFTLMHTYYFYDTGTAEDTPQYVNWNSKMDDWGFKQDFIWYPGPGHTFRMGFSSIFHRIQPGEVQATSQSGTEMSAVLAYQQALESGAYISGESKAGERLTLRYGLRVSHFMNIGPSTVYDYNEDYEVVDSAMYDKHEIYQHYQGLEPRLAANYMLNEQQSIKASYARTRQYIQLASNSTAGMPLEIWFMASPNIGPQISDQVSLGYFHNFLDHKLEASIELYYKQMTQSIDFRDHAQLLLNPRLDGEIRVGEGTAYGAEFYLKYEDQGFSGWISYTLSRATRIFPDINIGRVYNSPYDRPHELSLVASYDISPRVTLSASWIYSTGIPYTLPVGRQDIGGVVVPFYTERNSYRLWDYHRLDAGLTIKGKERDRRWRGEWNFSVYNAYNRKNIWTLRFVPDETQPNVMHAEMTYLLPILPAITYNFIF